MPWANYIRSTLKVLRDRGHPLPGVDLVIAGDIPQGTGLSSSAALLVAVTDTFRALAQLPLSPTDVALLAQEAERGFVGVNVGIMDQLISARGVKGHALMIDCRSLAATPVPVPEGAAILIVNSGIRRGLVDSAYNERRAQCTAAAAAFGVPALRDLDPESLDAGRALVDDLTFRRARHVVTENARVLAAAEALRAGDLAAMGGLMRASHASMRDDFQITVPGIDGLADILDAAIGDAGGARMTGGGFGGCVVALMPRASVEQVRDAVLRHYRTPGGTAPDIYVCAAVGGAGPVTA